MRQSSFWSGEPPANLSASRDSEKGLADPRGNLALVFLSIADRARPRWVVWENVPGVLSVDGGRAFGAFLGGLAELGYGFAYRVLDAQYFGLAQRRKRVFVVGHLGDWRPAAAVLFERASLSGDPPPRREARKGIAGSLTASAGRGSADVDEVRDGRVVEVPDVAWCLQERDAKGADSDTKEGHLIPVASVRHSGVTSCGDTAGPLDVDGHTAVAFAENSRAEVRLEGEDGSRTGALSTGGGKPGQGVPMIAQTVSLRGREGGGTAELAGDQANALRASQGGGDKPHVLTATKVRRLTPRECERLQGFPDDYTLIPWRTWQEAQRSGVSYESALRAKGMRLREPAGEACPDGPRYKALGNSMATKNMRWLGERIEQVEALLRANRGREGGG